MEASQGISTHNRIYSVVKVLVVGCLGGWAVIMSRVVSYCARIVLDKHWGRTKDAIIYFK